MSAWAGRDREWEVDDPGRGSLLAGVGRRPTGRSFGCLPSWSRTTSAYSFTGGATSPHNVSVPTHGGRLWYAVMTTYPQMRATAKVSRGGWRTEATARTPRVLRSSGTMRLGYRHIVVVSHHDARSLFTSGSRSGDCTCGNCAGEIRWIGIISV